LIVGIRTDFRAGEDQGLNPMISNIGSHAYAFLGSIADGVNIAGIPNANLPD